MSFQIILQENKSPSNKVTKDVTDIATATGVLRDGATILDPKILIESALESDILGRVNYAHIEQFHRYYYIGDITLDATGLWLFDMHVDVLMSYADEIREQNAVVARQATEGNFNLYLDDGWFMAYQDPIIQIKHFSVEGPFEHSEYVLVLAGNSPTA